MKDNEQTILHEFSFGNLKLPEVIGRLIAIGYLREDAEALASEWAEGLEQDA